MGDTPDLIEDEASVAYLTLSGVACPVRARLHAIDCTRVAGLGTVDVYDGHDAGGRPIWSSRDPAQLGAPHSFDPRKPVHIEQGIYVAITNCIVSVVYTPLAD